MDATALDTLGRMLPALGLVVGGLVLLRWWTARGTEARRGLRIVSRASLTKGTVVAVVEVDDRRFLVGGADQQLTLLAELDGPAVDTADWVPDDVGGLLAQLDPSATLATPADQTGPGRTGTTPRPGSGLVDVLRAMTVRTQVPGGSRARRSD